MVNTGSKKFLLAVIIITFVVAALIMAAIFYAPFGNAVRGLGGPLSTGIYNLITFLPKWGLSGGFPQALLIFVVLPLAACVVFAWIMIHFDVPGRITGASSSGASGGYQQSPQQNTIPINSGLQEAPTNQQKKEA